MNYDFVLIGLTSGGPKALYAIIDKFDDSLKLPIIIIQNLPIGFDKIFCQVFQEKAKMPIEIVENESTLENKIYLAKSGTILNIDEKKNIKSVNYQYSGKCITDFIKLIIRNKLKPIIVCLAGVIIRDDPIEGFKIARENDLPIIVQKIDENPNMVLQFETSLPERVIKEKCYTNISKLIEIPSTIEKIISK